MSAPPCRLCGAPLRDTFCDLGTSPLCESYLSPEQAAQAEAFHPLHARVCRECFLVQLPEVVPPEEIFTEYAYLSSYSTSWLRHAEAFAGGVAARLDLGSRSLVVELGSNDGYLLQYFLARGIPALGIEPAANVARAAAERGVETRVAFFDAALAAKLVAEGRSADLVVANNVLAQVPDLHSFVAGVRALLRPGGVVTIEVPHLRRLILGNQFDTIYHEHFSYFSFATVARLLSAHALVVFDVEELPTHGGSLRIFARRAEDESQSVSPRVRDVLRMEEDEGFSSMAFFERFETRVHETKRKLLELLIRLRREGARIVGYGAPGKGNTLLNYCGIRTDFLDFTVDRNPYKQGKLLPGTRIPIFAPEKIDEVRPDYVLVLPWNLADEIMDQLAHVRAWGCRFVLPIPEPVVVSGKEGTG